MGSYPALLCTPLFIRTPSLCVCGYLSGGLCTQFSSPLPQPSIPPTPTLNCCHSSCCRLSFGCHSSAHHLQREEGGRTGEAPSQPGPPPSPAASTRSPGGGKSRGHSIL